MHSFKIRITIVYAGKIQKKEIKEGNSSFTQLVFLPLELKIGRTESERGKNNDILIIRLLSLYLIGTGG